MLSTFLLAFGLFLLLEGLAPLMAPQTWRQMLRLVSEMPVASLRRFGGCLVVAGAVIIWMVSHW